MKQLLNDKNIPVEIYRWKMHEVAKRLLYDTGNNSKSGPCDYIAVLLRYGFAMFGDEEMGRSI